MRLGLDRAAGYGLAMRLSDADKSSIEKRVAAFEQATGAQAVVSVVDRCDSYPEIPWRAFALATVLAALCVWMLPLAETLSAPATPLMLMGVLGMGMSAAIVSVLAPPLGRFLLPRERREAEVRQFAQATFLTRELFETRGRSALLILVGRFERHAVILADHGTGRRLADGQRDVLAAQLNQALRRGSLADAVRGALDSLEDALGNNGVPSGPNEIADSVIRERGH